MVKAINMPKHYRRSNGPRPIIKSYKKVLNFAGTSQSIGNHSDVLTNGKDSTAIGQTGPTDKDVPTGSYVKYIEIQYSAYNGVNVAAFLHFSIQLLHANQTFVDPRLVGGNPQRNQVLHQALATIGQLQSFSRNFKFKIPKRFQRVREGDRWEFVYHNSAAVNDIKQIIYKVYQ